MKNEPICMCQWYHTRSDGGMDRMIGRWLKNIESDKCAQIRTALVQSRREFIKAISDWHHDSTNTQYLMIVAHGAKNQAGEWFGIGSSPDGVPLDRQDRIEWREFWNVVVKRKKLTATLLIGCKTAEAAKAFTPMLTKRDNNPYLIGLTETVSRAAKRKTLRLARWLLENMHSTERFLDEEWELMRKAFPAARLYYPVVAIKGIRARYVDVDDMEAEIGMTFKEYLGVENDWLEERYLARREKRIRKQNQG